MKINNIAVTAAALALAIVASANAATPAYTVTPFVKGGVQFVDSGLKDKGAQHWSGSVSNYKDSVGGGFTAGVLVNQRHEFSLSTGFVSFEGTPPPPDGIASANSKVEQLPLLLNYSYHLPVDAKGRFTVYGGPTIGVINQKTSFTQKQLGSSPAAFIGTNSVTDNLFAYGATIGFDTKLSSHWTAGVSAQVLEVSSSSSVHGMADSRINLKKFLI